MELLIDANLLMRQKAGGVSRLYRAILPRCLSIGKGLDVRLAYQGAVIGGQSIHVPKELAPWVEEIPRVGEEFWPWRFWRHARPRLDTALNDLFWRRQHPDVFHPVHFSSQPVKAPTFCFVYDMTYELYPECFDGKDSDRFRRQKADVIRRAQIVLCISENTRRDVIRLLKKPAESCRVVYLAGFATESQFNVIAIDGMPSEPFFLYVGSWYVPYKNFEFLLRCLGSRQFRDLQDYHLVVASARMPSAEERRAFDAIIDKRRLHFICGSSDEELRFMYSQCTALVYPSFYEGFGIPLVEAFSCGCPVVAAENGAFVEIGNGVAALFDPKSPSAFHAALHSAIREGRHSQAVRRRKNRAAMFSWDKTAHAFYQACCDVC